MVIINNILLQATLAAVALAAASNSTNTSTNGSLPKVDLGYEIHQAASYDSTTQIYKFNSIRYAAAPVGDLAFAPPQTPPKNRGAVQNGSAGKNCFSGIPDWSAELERQLEMSTNQTRTNTTKQAAQPAPTTPEGQDCLFLDVYTTKNNFEKKAKASVIVWIHGGGYIMGNKEIEPWTLMGRRKDGVVVVAINYRLGAFGFLAGDYLTSGGGVTNLGFRDQRFALEWVQKNIGLFGGDPSKVTIMGESAGGGSVMCQITAYGGAKTVPFARAIPQSPDILVQSKCDADKTYKEYLVHVGCKNNDPKAAISCLRKKTADQLQQASMKIIGKAYYGMFGFYPGIDGDFLRDAPGPSFAKGAFAKNIEVLAGHNTDEGFVFTDPKIGTGASNLLQFVRNTVPSAPNSTIGKFIDLYPARGNNKDEFARTDLWLSELQYTCGMGYLGRALGNKSYNYLFAAEDGWHSQDIGYTWYNGAKDADLNVAITLQDYITSFAIDGKPTSQRQGLPSFPQYGKEQQVMKISDGGVGAVTRDPAANKRCDFLQAATYLGVENCNAPFPGFSNAAAPGSRTSILVYTFIVNAVLVFSFL